MDRPASAEQGTSVEGILLVLRESEGTVKKAPFQTCASEEEGCRNQVTGSSIRHTACHSRSIIPHGLLFSILRKLDCFLLVHLLFHRSFEDGHIHLHSLFNK